MKIIRYNNKLIMHLLLILFNVSVYFNLPLAVAASPGSVVKLRLINYTAQPLFYLNSGVTFNSAVVLPSSIPATDSAAGAQTNGLVTAHSFGHEANGTIKIGYDNGHYCIFSYDMKKTALGWSWYLQSSHFIKMGNVSCSVDPDAHKTIVFQDM